ncbi:polymorphic toxin type 44 domain-containing protein [Nocardia sp. NPDC058633]|uniref:polymorphic toxin type 44 domain-containing protein n=1 Tax=Nocardia sp. NPDC058633 TaxID=3346568 RepID=UPI003666A09B
MPTRAELDRWDINKLRVWATEIRRDSADYEAQLYRMNTHFADIGWSGKAKDAAGDRVAEHVDEGRKLAIENSEFADALDAGASRLDSERSTVRTKVQEAESDVTAAATFKVSNEWLVEIDTVEVPINEDGPRYKAIPTQKQAHQDAINTAVASLLSAISEFNTAITTNAQEIRTRGNQFGDGNSRESAASPITSQRLQDAKAELDRLIELKYMGVRVDPVTGASVDTAIDEAKNEYNKWKQLADTQMNLDDYTMSEERFIEAESFIFDEMKRNVNSADVARMAELNDADWWEVASSSTNDPAAALLAFKEKVEVGAEWDHKPQLEDRFDLSAEDDYYFKDPSQDRAVYYDLYSNIHYGYVGRAAGFPEDTLIWAANQGGSTGANDVGDDISMRIGSELYEKYGNDMTQAQLHEGIEQAMQEMDQAMSEGESVTQIRVTQ